MRQYARIANLSSPAVRIISSSVLVATSASVKRICRSNVQNVRKYLTRPMYEKPLSRVGRDTPSCGRNDRSLVSAGPEGPALRSVRSGRSGRTGPTWLTVDDAYAPQY